MTSEPSMNESAAPFCFTGILEAVRYLFEAPPPFTGEPRESLGPRHLPLIAWLASRVDLYHPLTTTITQAEFIAAGGDEAGFHSLIEVLDAAIWIGAAGWQVRIPLSQCRVYGSGDRRTVVFCVNDDAVAFIHDLVHRARATGQLVAASDPSRTT